MSGLRSVDPVNTLPPASGISLKPQHYDALLDDTESVSWLEVHPENYMGKGGAPHHYLRRIREKYPLSMHGVGMSLGSADGIEQEHLSRLKKLVDLYEPQQVSEHLSWSHWNATFLNDLLPLPYTTDSLNVVCENIDRVQTSLGRPILVENPSVYIDFKLSDYTEAEFFTEMVKRSGCKVLLDLNNVFVSGFNNNFDPYDYLNKFPVEFAAEIHLAGHERKRLTDKAEVCIDDHGSEVSSEVWGLYRHFIALKGAAVPTLIEWDTNVPALDKLLREADKVSSHFARALSQQSVVEK